MDFTPTWKYCYCGVPNPLLDRLVEALRANGPVIRRVRDERYTRSQDVEKALQDDLSLLGFSRSVTVQSVPGLFAPASDFEIDFYSSQHMMGLEVEKGKHFSVWRNLIKFCESPQVRHGVLIVPQEKKVSQGVEKVFDNTLASLGNVQYLYERLDSLLCLGY